MVTGVLLENNNCEWSEPSQATIVRPQSAGREGNRGESFAAMQDSIERLTIAYEDIQPKGTSLPLKSAGRNVPPADGKNCPSHVKVYSGLVLLYYF